MTQEEIPSPPTGEPLTPPPSKSPCTAFLVGAHVIGAAIFSVLSNITLGAALGWAWIWAFLLLFELVPRKAPRMQVLLHLSIPILVFLGFRIACDRRMQRLDAQGIVVAASLERYHQDNQRYPEDLGELFPKYLSNELLGSDAGVDPDLRYHLLEGEPTMMYFVWSLTERRSYSFRSRHWGTWMM